MEKRELVNIWYDRPGDFLEIRWAKGWDVNEYVTPEAEIGANVYLTDDWQAVGLHILGALYSPYRREGQSQVVAAVQPHPVTVSYDRRRDLWRAQWGPAVAEGIATPNPRIQALVDAAGQIQGVEIRDLRSFEEEILNQNLYPAELGVKAG